MSILQRIQNHVVCYGEKNAQAQKVYGRTIIVSRGCCAIFSGMNCFLTFRLCMIFFWWAFFAVQLFFWILPVPPKKKQWSVSYQSDFLDVHPVSVVLLKFGNDSPGRALVQCDDVLHLVWTNVLSIFLDISRGKRMLRASFVRTIQRYANVHRSSVVTTGSLHSSPLSGLNACKGLKGNNSGECSQKIVSVAVPFWSYYHSTTATATYFMCFRFPFFFYLASDVHHVNSILL